MYQKVVTILVRTRKSLKLTVVGILIMLMVTGVQAANLLRNSNFEAGTAHYFLHGTSTTGESMTLENTGAYRGSRCVKIQKTNDLGEVLLVSDNVAIATGTQVTFSAYIRVQTPNQHVHMRMWSYNASNQKQNSGDMILIIGDTLWHRFSMTWTTLPAQGNLNRVAIVLPQAITGTIWVDALQLEQGAMTGYAAKQNLELGITPNVASNLYYNTQTVYPTFTVRNNTSSKKNVTIELTTTDFADQVVNTRTILLSPSGWQYAERQEDLTPANLGYFKVSAVLKLQGTPQDNMAWAFGRVTQEPVTREERFGLCMEQENMGFELPRAKILGAGAIRIQNCLIWGNVEPSQDNFDWRYGQFVPPVDVDFSPTLYLSTVPGWAQMPGNPYMPANINDYKDYVDKVVLNYKQYMDDWEVMNEPKLYITAGDYYTLLDAAYGQAKLQDPNCTVMGLCGFVVYQEDQQYRRDVFALGGLNRVDVVSLHPYLMFSGHNPEDHLAYYLQLCRDDMADYGNPDKPIWISEYGIGASDWPWEPDFEGAQTWGLNEKGQAQYLAASMVTALASTVDRFYWFISQSHVFAGGYTPTIFAPDSLSSVKKAAPAYAVLARKLNGLTYQNKLNVDGPKDYTTATDTMKVHAHRFKDASRQVIVAWQEPDGPGSMKLWVRGGSLTATDIMGNPVTLTADGSYRVIVPLTIYPVYLETSASTYVYPLRIVKNDYDRDQKYDCITFKYGTWTIFKSSTNWAQTDTHGFGNGAHTPLSGDYDGDKKCDLALWDGNTTWWIRKSSNGYNPAYDEAYTFGQPGDIPMSGDYDGDMITDLAKFWQGWWTVIRSSDGSQIYLGLGNNNQVPMSGDVEGDGAADIIVFDPTTLPPVWWWYTSSSGFTTLSAWQSPFGEAGDVPVSGDYDGDGRMDFGFYRPLAGISGWYIWLSTTNYTTYVSYGWGSSSTNDIPLSGDWDGDLITDVAISRPGIPSTWYIRKSSDGQTLTFSAGDQDCVIVGRVELE